MNKLSNSFYSTLQNIRTCFFIIKITNHKKLFFLNIFLILGASTFEIFGISLLIPIFENLTNPSDEISKFEYYLIIFFEYAGLKINLTNILIFFLLIQFLKYIFVLSQMYYSRVISAETVKKLRNSSLAKIYKTKYHYFYKHKYGDLLSTVFVSTLNSGATLENLVILIKSIIYFIFYLTVAFLISVKLSALLIILVLICYFLVLPIIYKSKILGQQNKMITDDIITNLNNKLKGLKIIKIFNLKNKVVDEFQIKFHDYSKNSIEIMKNKIFSYSLFEPLILFSLIFGLIIFSDTIIFNFSSFIVILIIFTLLIPQLKSLNANLLQINELMPHFDKVNDIYKINKDDYFTTEKHKINFKKITFSNVIANYENNNDFQLSINYTFYKNKTYGIVGPSGSGKTTFINLILKLQEVNQGNILIDDNDLNEIPIDVWCNNISYVDQDNFLFNDTIKNNIILDKDANQDLNNFNKILELSNLDNTEIDYNKFVNDLSTNISGGQKQRISFARAIYKNFGIIILDEFTSNLDVKNEIIINNYIKSLKGKKTVIIIGHKNSLIKNADEILFIKNGKIVESGNHDTLISKKTNYYNFFNEK